MPGRDRFSFAYGAALGFACDLLLGDPRRGHPVAAFGRAAQSIERRLWRDHRGYGTLHTLVCAGGAVAGAGLLARAARRHRAAEIALTAAATWSVLGGTSLGREARAIGGALAAGDVEVARERLPHLCGRDPQALDAQAIARPWWSPSPRTPPTPSWAPSSGAPWGACPDSWASGRSTPWTPWWVTSRPGSGGSAGRRPGSTTSSAGRAPG